MKKIIIFLLFLIVFPLCQKNTKNINEVSSKSETTTYAKALENCIMFKSEELIETPDNVFFIVPESYFVILLDSVSDECFKVQYQKYIGYVSSKTVIVSTFIPIVKFLDNITFDIKDTSGTQVWNKPNTDGRVLTTISAGSKNIKYIAFVYGNIPSGGESNLWYYVSYTPSVNSTNVYEGYVYSENTTNLSSIAYNTECNPEVIENQNSDGETFYVSSTIKTIVVVIISVPIILFIFIILYNLLKKCQKRTRCRKNENNYNEVQDVHNFQNEFSNNKDVYENANLKSKLEKMKGSSFVKKKSNFYQKQNIPEFPDYTNDDDLL